MTSEFVIKKGTTWKRTWPVLNRDKTPASLVGFTAKSQIREVTNAATVIHEFSTALGTITIVDNLVTLTLEPADSSDWTWNQAVIDIRLTSPTGDKYIVGKTRVTLELTVTRDA